MLTKRVRECTVFSLPYHIFRASSAVVGRGFAVSEITAIVTPLGGTDGHSVVHSELNEPLRRRSAEDSFRTHLKKDASDEASLSDALRGITMVE
jgi:hypothetical protein